MFQEYFELYKTYTQKYGPKTAIFLMVGAFYELYEIQNREGETRSNVKEIVDILGINVSIKKDVEPNHDGLVAGFPDYVLHKWAGRLTSIGWTVVIVDQIKERGKVVDRKVSRILSPSTHIENTTSSEIPYVVTLHFQSLGLGQHSLGPHSFGTGPHTFGAAALDLTTGTTHTYYGTTSGNSEIWTAYDLVQLLNVFQPKELLIYWNGKSPDVSTFRRILGVQCPIHVRPEMPLKELARFEYFQKVYSIKSVLPVKTYLGLRSELEETALLFLLQFVEEHYPSMLKSFHRNTPWCPNSRLICGNNALTQLQMTGLTTASTAATTSIIDLFDKCITPMGKRAIKERLLSPYSDPIEIQKRLKEVQENMTCPDIKIVERQLRFISDLPRLHRKIQCGLITPQEITALFQSYAACKVILKITKNTLLESSTNFEKYFEVFTSNFNEEKALNASNDLTAFSDKYKEISEKEGEIQEILTEFLNLKNEIAKMGGVPYDTIKMEEREKEPFGFKCSKITLIQLKKNQQLKISELKSGGWIDCTKLQELNTKLQKLRDNLDDLVKIYLLDACQEISVTGQDEWSTMEQWISRVDCTRCISTISKEKGYCCPTIESDTASSFSIKGVRHPLVEASSTRAVYVQHDISLNEEKGWLVYGMNASGKSTLMKATGICILLAQAGCFVPAREMTLTPFKAIYTRILNQDNLSAGLSSFAVEMSELRDILRNANENTLVLGDELCSGTESVSAQALVASGIQWLISKNAKFIFATHLHGIPDVINTKDLKIWHLHVEYDSVTKKLIYDRSLREGSGSTLYGLEVARAMDLPFEFIEQALQNRHKITGSAKKSSWNTDIIRKECEICHKESGLEVHHIKPRAEAKNGILEDGTHMNDKRNLIVICQKCHDETHDGKIEIGEIKITSDGPERIISKSNKLKSSKWSEEETKIIMDTLEKYSKLSLKALRAHLSSKHEIEISEGMLSKFRKL